MNNCSIACPPGKSSEAGGPCIDCAKGTYNGMIHQIAKIVPGKDY